MVPTYIIAEGGVNHNGKLEIAKRLVKEAKGCGADAIKFQTFNADKLASKYASKASYQKSHKSSNSSQLNMLKRLQLRQHEFKLLSELCIENGITFLSSPFDEASADFLDSIGMSVFKIPSGEITNYPFLKYIARKGKPIIISTGMSYLGEVEKALNTIEQEGNRQITILHCVTEYPAPVNEINLRAIITLKEAFKLPVGYSDHTVGIEIPIAAVAIGATVIEKHFTLNSRMYGPDHKSSMEPDLFKEMVRCIRNTESALGDGIKKPANCEMDNIALVRKSIHTANPLKAGHKISEKDLTLKRPGIGLDPSMISFLIGRKIKNRIGSDTPITLLDLE